MLKLFCFLLAHVNSFLSNYLFSKFINKCQKEILRCAPPSLHVCNFYFFCVHEFVSVSVSLCAWEPICNPFQDFKNSFLWGSQSPLRQKMIETQWLTSGDWDCCLGNDPKIVLVQRNRSACICDLLFTARTKKKK